MEEARAKAVPKRTLDDMKYCVGIWNELRYHRQAHNRDLIPEVDELDSPDLANLLSHFVLEVRKNNGEEFPPNSYHHIVSGIQHHLRLNRKPANVLL